MDYITHTEAETRAIGATLGKSLAGGDVLLLAGDLGAGKTTFVKGLAEGMGISLPITSPTFTLMNVYDVKNPASPIEQLVHIDTYRLENERQLLEIGIEDYFSQPEAVCVIEWPEKIERLLEGKKVIAISLTHLSPEMRQISIRLPD